MGEFLSQRWERNQRIAGGRLRMSAPRSYSPYPRSPITGVTPWAGQIIFGAQNLSGFHRFIPGHRALGLQKLPLVRFHSCAWLCRANGTRSVDGGSPKGLPYSKMEGFLETRRGGDDSPYQWEMARRARGDRELPLPPYIGNLSSSAGRPVSGP